jgi:C4-dicarboxylate-specific signal transduction histidine kinase
LHTTDFEQRLVDTNQSLEQTLQKLKGTQSQLIQSEKTHALEYFSAGILHEINNPLNYTLTALQLARGLPAAKNDAMLPEIFDDMHEGMTRIKSIVGDLQAFAHSSPVDKQASFKLAQAVRTALTFTSKDAGSMRIVDETDKEAQVIGSRNHVVQVLINLITNALKAVRAVEAQRKGEILLRSALHDNRVLVMVRDNGTGIDQAILGKIFDPFFTTRDVGEGMGLGLAVSQTIIKAHGGQLKASSVQGEWTEFSFDLPADVKGA